MNLQSIKIFVFFFIFSTPVYSAKICYFSLNNLKEFQEMDKFTSKLNKFSKEKIEVKEFLTPGANAEESFQKMVESGEKCDGLAISGHHTGSFGGKNSPVTLSIDFMEKLSCNPQYKDFFSNIKALWLQGCRTLGVGQIETYEDPDFHTERVGQDLAADNLPQDFAQLNMEFSATLDKDNPLSSRYLRVFPRATTFGWTKTAPGEKAHSEYSIPYHIANIAKENDDRGQYFDNPVGDTLSEKSAVKYLTSLMEVLGKSFNSPQVKCHRDEEKLINSWKLQGDIHKSPYAFNNPDLNAFESLLHSNNDALVMAKKLDCLLKNANDSSLIDSIDTILKDKLLIGYSFNSINELLQRLKSEGKFDLLTKIQNKLQGNQLLQHFLMSKLSSKELGILRKIDYYAFWKNMTNSSNDQIEKVIEDVFVKMATTPTKNDRNKMDYIATLFQSMKKHELITTNQLQKIIKESDDDKLMLVLCAGASVNSGIAPKDTNKILTQIAMSKNANEDALISISDALAASEIDIPGSDKMIQTIMNLPATSSQSLGYLARSIGTSNRPLPDADDTLLQLTTSAKSDNMTLFFIAQALNHPKHPISNSEKILKVIVDSPKAETRALGVVANTLSSLDVPMASTEKLLLDIFKNPKLNSNIISHLAMCIGNAHLPIKGSVGLLQQLINSPKGDESSLEDIEWAISNSTDPEVIKNRSQLTKLLKAKK
jgi:hypothetical protein